MKRLLLALTLLAIGSPVLAADERIGTMPGSAAPRAWRNNTPEGFIKKIFASKMYVVTTALYQEKVTS